MPSKLEYGSTSKTTLLLHVAWLSSVPKLLHRARWNRATWSLTLPADAICPVRIRPAASRVAPSSSDCVTRVSAISTMVSISRMKGGPTIAISTATEPLSSRRNFHGALIGMPSRAAASVLSEVLPEPEAMARAARHLAPTLLFPIVATIVAAVARRRLASRRMLPDDLGGGMEGQALNAGQLHQHGRDRCRRRNDDDRVERIAHAQRDMPAGRPGRICQIEIALHARLQRRGGLAGRARAQRQRGIVERRVESHLGGIGTRHVDADADGDERRQEQKPEHHRDGAVAAAPQMAHPDDHAGRRHAMGRHHALLSCGSPSLAPVVTGPFRRMRGSGGAIVAPRGSRLLARGAEAQ